VCVFFCSLIISVFNVLIVLLHGYRYMQTTANPARNPKAAVAPLKKACANYHGSACYNLAVLYKAGDIGVPKNDKEFEHYKTLVEKFGLN
jgi:TPR repeat protein